MSDNEFEGEDGEMHQGAPLARRDDYAMTETRAQNETAAMAVAARVTAMIQARFVIAAKKPRVLDDVRVALLRECERPGFADCARYKRPVGKKEELDENGNKTGRWVDSFAEGPSIRFIEAAVRLMGNLGPGVTVLYDDQHKRILRCEVIDYETGSSWDRELTLEKTVERRKLKDGQRPLRSRRNSYGDTVYIVEAEPGEFAVREGAEISKCLRVLAQRLIPGDLTEECMTQVLATQKNRDAKDPAAARKALVDNFSKLGVKASDLQDYLGGRPLDGATPDQILELRAVGAALKDGEGTWAQALDASPYRVRAEQPAGAAPVETPKATTAFRERVEKTTKAAKAKRAAASQATTPAPGDAKASPTAPATQGGPTAPAEGKAASPATPPPPTGAQEPAKPGKPADPDPHAGFIPPAGREPGSDG